MLPWVTAVCNVRKGWEYSREKNNFRLTKGTTYVYVSRLNTGYCLQLFILGAVERNHYCLAEIKTENHTKESLEKLYVKGETWLKLYCDGKEESNLLRQAFNIN